MSLKELKTRRLSDPAVPLLGGCSQRKPQFGKIRTPQGSFLFRQWLRLFATPGTVACQAPLSLEFSRQEAVFIIARTCVLSHFNRVRLCATLQTVAPQAPLSMGFSRQEHRSGLPQPSSRRASQPKDQTHVSCVSCTGRQVLYHYLGHGGYPNVHRQTRGPRKEEEVVHTYTTGWHSATHTHTKAEITPFSSNTDGPRDSHTK